MNKERHMYHYCAQYLTSSGASSLSEGVVAVASKVNTIVRYNALKEYLVKEINSDIESTAITSLSYLGPEDKD